MPLKNIREYKWCMQDEKYEEMLRADQDKVLKIKNKTM